MRKPWGKLCIYPRFIGCSPVMAGGRLFPDRNIRGLIRMQLMLLKKLPEIVAAVVNKEETPVRLMFQDEARFGRISNPRRCWAPAGIRPEVPKQIVRQFTYAFVTVSPHDGVLDSLVPPEVNSAMMSLFLEEVSFLHPDEFILMFMDKAGWHRAKDLVVPLNIKIEWLPPYSPQANPTENIWDEIREKSFANYAFHSMDAVEDTLVNALSNMESKPTLVQSIAGFPWIISISLIAN